MRPKVGTPLDRVRAADVAFPEGWTAEMAGLTEAQMLELVIKGRVTHHGGNLHHIYRGVPSMIRGRK